MTGQLESGAGIVEYRLCDTPAETQSTYGFEP